MGYLSEHPPDVELLAWVDGDQFAGFDLVASHVRRCDVCQLSCGELVALLPAASPLAFSFSGPLRKALWSERPGPAVGQLWRCAWGGVVQLVLLTGCGRDLSFVRAVPLVERDDSSGDVLVVDAGVLGWPGVAQLSLVSDLPLCVLDLFLGDASNWAVRGVAALVMSPLDRRAAELAVVQDDMQSLAAAVPDR